MVAIDLNSDLGESWGAYSKGEDEAVLSIITSANVACGYHAGDPVVMRDTLKTAKIKEVAVGAHPSYLDLIGLGRLDHDVVLGVHNDVGPLHDRHDIGHLHASRLSGLSGLLFKETWYFMVC